ncbi:hypothetical protein BDZ89DRAFT_1162278 [Hymenopellis radicata]|nr:hypothetical protein BDZ89DRAFT_1162278 [Hymenopellis radicata]
MRVAFRPTYLTRYHPFRGELLIRGESTKAVTSASDKLFADASREEQSQSAPKSAHLSALESQHENWTGDESIQDAVLRMLVDKYKPLRTGTIQTAEEKLKRAPPSVSLGTKAHFRSVEHPSPLSTPSSGSWITETLLPAKEGHKPWHTEYKVPSHAASIKLASFPLRSSTPTAPIDDKLRKQDKEAKKRVEQAGKLHRARESTLDYRLGVKKAHVGGRPNPVSMKGWSGLVEDKIEKARQAGIFKTVRGRGQPMSVAVEERNPFIAREEFLMNRIVQRNGAAPPWVDLQQTLDISIQTFRDILRQSWTRQALRKLTTEHPAPILATLTLEDIKKVRDNAWMQRQEGYHDAAMDDVNSMVRKYNGIAPYAVRRPYYSRAAEIERLYEACAEDILRELQRRFEGSSEIDQFAVRPKVPDGVPLDLKRLWRFLLEKFVGLFIRK